METGQEKGKIEVMLAQRSEAEIQRICGLSVWKKYPDVRITRTVTDGEEALLCLSHHYYHLCILDIGLSVFGGLYLAEHLKSGGSDMRVVLTEQELNYQNVRSALQMKVFDYLLLPVQEEELEEIFQRLYRQVLQTEELPREETLYNTENIYQWIAIGKKEMALRYQEYVAQPPGEPAKGKAEESGREKENAGESIMDFRRANYSSTMKAFFFKVGYLDQFLDIHRSYTLDRLAEAFSDEELTDADAIRVYCVMSFILELHPYTRDTLMEEILDYILEHIDGGISQSALAAHFYQTEAGISKLFLKNLNLHYNEYIGKIKLLRAEYLLLNSDLLVYEISDRIGYRDYNYFTKVFKRAYGKTPQEFRQEYGAL